MEKGEYCVDISRLFPWWVLKEEYIILYLSVYRDVSIGSCDSTDVLQATWNNCLSTTTVTAFAVIVSHRLTAYYILLELSHHQVGIWTAAWCYHQVARSQWPPMHHPDSKSWTQKSLDQILLWSTSWAVRIQAVSASHCLGFKVLHSFHLIRKCKPIPEPKSPIWSKATKARQTTVTWTHKGELFISSLHHTNISRDVCALESPRGIKVLIIDCEVCKLCLVTLKSPLVLKHYSHY